MINNLTSQCAPSATGPSTSASLPSRQTGTEDCGFPDLPATQMKVEVIRDVNQLEQLVPAWQRLVEVSVEPNIFYEPEFLIPAIKNFADPSVEVVVLTVPARVNPHSGPIICGIFPVRRSRKTYGVPIKSIEMWEHAHFHSTTPLIRKDVLAETWQQFYEWTAKSTKAKSIVIDRLTGDSRLHRTIIDWLNQNEVEHLVKDRHHRELLQKGGNVDEILDNTIPGKQRDELNRVREKLVEEHGTIVVETLGPESSINELRSWRDELFELESKGFEGLAGLSVLNNEADQRFLIEMTDQMFANGKLSMNRLVVENENTFRGTETIAMNLNLLTDNGSFAFKVAFDKSFRQFSLGLLLEIENVRWLLESPNEVEWLDSCAGSIHPMTKKLWSNRRLIESLVISTGSRRANLAVAGLPLMRAIFKADWNRTSRQPAARTTSYTVRKTLSALTLNKKWNDNRASTDSRHNWLEKLRGKTIQSSPS